MSGTDTPAPVMVLALGIELRRRCPRSPASAKANLGRETSATMPQHAPHQPSPPQGGEGAGRLGRHDQPGGDHADVALRQCAVHADSFLRS